MKIYKSRWLEDKEKAKKEKRDWINSWLVVIVIGTIWTVICYYIVGTLSDITL